MSRRSLAHPILGALSAALALASTAVAHGQTSLVSGFGGTVGYGTQCLAANDDGSSRAIDLTPAFPSGLRFFDRTHTRAFVNTNGNITFSAALSQYTAEAFPVAEQPMIAPFWADVDIRRLSSGTCSGGAGAGCSPCEPCHNPSENGVWWHLERNRMVVTWDRVGRYDCKNDRRMSFQLILTAVDGCGGAGDFDVEFRYNRCEWEAGDASCDESGDGLCQPGEACDDLFGAGEACTPAQAGFDAGNSRDFVAIAGSLTPGVHTRLCTTSNVGEAGVWRFQIRSGSVVCPDAGAVCSTGLMGVCASGRTNCVGGGTECVQDVMASPERCDALDNDCDGRVDESPETLCGPGEVCAGGTCLVPCFESGCFPGQVCLPSGLCIDEGCQTITCPDGQRCRAGACVGACDGVVCPAGRSCRGGRCVDLCEGLACDDCTVCEDGLCASRCQFAPCASGRTCLADGRCVEPGCVDRACPAGTVCRGGSCVDACAGAVCPDGQECRTGECVAARLPDDGGVPRPDAGVLDAGSAPRDGGPNVTPMDAGLDGGRPGPPPRTGTQCACRAAGAGGSSPGLLALGALVGLAWVWRRRARR